MEGLGPPVTIDDHDVSAGGPAVRLFGIAGHQARRRFQVRPPGLGAVVELGRTPEQRHRSRPLLDKELDVSGFLEFLEPVVFLFVPPQQGPGWTGVQAGPAGSTPIRFEGGRGGERKVQEEHSEEEVRTSARMNEHRVLPEPPQARHPAQLPLEDGPRIHVGEPDYFLGARSLPWWALLLSIVATETSTVTFLSLPGIAGAADGDLTFLQITFGYIAGRFLIIRFLLPLYFQGQAFTAYETLERRFGKLSRRAASSLFLVTRNVSDALRLFLTALVLQIVLDLDLALSVIVLGAITIVYTLVGGARSVIWNDCIQFIVYMVGAAAALAVIVNGIPGGWDDLFRYGVSQASAGSRTTPGGYGDDQQQDQQQSPGPGTACPGRLWRRRGVIQIKQLLVFLGELVGFVGMLQVEQRLVHAGNACGTGGLFRVEQFFLDLGRFGERLGLDRIQLELRGADHLPQFRQLRDHAGGPPQPQCAPHRHQ